jgi:hypothetical protein
MYTRTGEESVRHARRLNLIADVAEENELQIDLDTPEQEEQYRRMRPHVEDIYDIEDVIETPSKSGKTHVRIFTAYPLSVEERVALQAILGSDPKKELCSLQRWLAGDEIPILLFEKPEVHEEIQKRRK